MRRHIHDLALLGGEPAFPQRLHVGRPNIGNADRLRARIDDILERRWLTNGGPYVREFEGRVASLLGVNHCIAVANGMTALEIAIHACGLSGEVIVPSFTFVGTAHALQWVGLTPVFCDIREDTHNIDPDQVESLITPRTSAILAVHLWGRAAPVDELARLTRKHGLRLIFDGAHALACSVGGQMLGGFGDAEILSFHATKFVNTGEGGAIVTNDSTLDARIRSMKNFGFVDYDLVGAVGTNGKMSEFAAAMGLTSLESLEEFRTVNHSHYDTYRQELEGLPGIRVMEYDSSEHGNYQYIVVDVGEASPLSRDQLVRVLVAEGIIARRYFYPGCHRMEPYRSLRPHDAARLPVTERVAGRVLQLPNGTAMDRATVAQVASVIRTAIEHPGPIASLPVVAPERIYDWP